MVIEITLQRLLYLVVRYTFWSCAVALLPFLLESLIKREKFATKIYIAIMLACLSIFMIMGLFSSCVH